MRGLDAINENQLQFHAQDGDATRQKRHLFDDFFCVKLWNLII
jgi:hypothetical protein